MRQKRLRCIEASGVIQNHKAGWVGRLRGNHSEATEKATWILPGLPIPTMETIRRSRFHVLFNVD